MLTQLIDLLHKLDLDPTPKEIGEMLWLADYLDAPNRETLDATDASKLNNRPRLDHAWQTPPTRKHSESESASEIRSSVEQPTVAEEPQAKLYSGQVQEEADPGGIKGIDFRSPGVPALPNALELARALRPFKRATLSRTKHIFDEKASIDAAADAGNPIPVLRPAPSRWLDIVLVVDESPSMVIWRATIQELQRLLERQGAFRNAQLWRLQYESERSDPRLQIGAGNGHEQRAHRASELIDPSGQRLILIVTDCVSPAWERTGIATLIKTWGTWGPVAIVQMLPKYLWSGTALGDMPEVHLRAKLPGLPNVQLDIKWLFDDYDDVLRRWLQSQENRTAGMVVPVVTLEPRTLASWSTALATGNSAWITGFFFPITPLPQLTEGEFDSETDLAEAAFDARSLVENFNRTASPTARKLARYLAAAPLNLAAAPLTLPVMRLVQGAMLPDSLQVHLAEVFLSGLIERQTPEIADIALDEVQYKFVNGVQEVLLASSRISTAIDVLRLVSDYVSKRIGQPLDFRAWIAAPTEERNYVSLSGERYFATIASKVLSHIGAASNEKDEWLAAFGRSITDLNAVHLALESAKLPDPAAFVANLRSDTQVLGSTIAVDNSIDSQNVAIGKEITQNYTHIAQQVIHQAPPPPHTERYLQRLRNHCHALPLRAMGGDATAGDEVTLDKVYIELDTTTKVALTEEEQKARKAKGVNDREKERPVSAREAAQTTTRLVLLGAPVSGKSTFVRQLMAQLIGARLEGSAPPPGFTADLFPLLTILRELARRLQVLALTGLSDDARDEALMQCIQTQWQSDLARFGGADLGKQLEESLLTGKVLLVFDGLDEMATTTRPLVRLALAALLRRYPTVARVIVTCRIRSYVGLATLPGFTAYTLADFTEAQIDAFVAAWYGAQAELGRFDTHKAQSQRTDLQQAARRPALRAMAANPMLLTTMAIIHQKQTRLPDERVKLYDEAVKVLLNRWQESKGLAPSPALAAFLRDDRRVRPTLERLAYEAHHQKGKEAADLSRTTLLGLLEESFAGDLMLASEFLDYADHRAGLLMGQGGGEGSGRPQSYAFPHRTFQEYLAGCHLLAGEGNQRGVGRVYRRHAAEGDYWQLAAQLGAEELFFNRRGEALLLDLMYALCPVTPLQSEQAWRTTLWSGQMALLFDRKAIAQDEDTEEGGQAYLDRLVPRLLAIMRESRLNAIERAEAGRTLAKLGDPRSEVLDPLQIEWIEIPAGPFIMGSDEYNSQKPQHIFTIPAAYRIARYPITNAHFQCFVDDHGYAHAAYWTEAADHGYWTAAGFKGRLDNRHRTGPSSYGEPFTLTNHPVVGVSWYEALAFSRWLTEELQEAKQLPSGWVVRLPTEAEWEKAARGEDGQPYPWPGDQPDPNRANYDDTGINGTNAVGAFPGGVSPYGVEGMAGNVWEWCSTLWGTDSLKPDFGYPYIPTDGRENLAADSATQRVLRGGAFGNVGLNVRCAARIGGSPYFEYERFGLRVVLSPLPLASAL